MPYAVEMLGITKIFPGLIANDNVTLKVLKGEVHALLGENGAGKSTLMSVLFGAYHAESGTIRINEREVRIVNSNQATDLGIGMVHQHFKLVHNYTVTENIVLGIEKKGKFGMLDLASSRKRIATLCEQYGFDIDPDALAENLTVGQQQKVEIVKTLYRDADIIIFDEPTAVLLPQEIDEFMKIILTLKKEGKTIILITHKLKEIKAVADRCTILRKGKYIDCVDVPSVSEEQLANLMVGRAVKFNVEKGVSKPGEKVIEISGLCVDDEFGVRKVSDLSLDVREGEIVGIAGVDGNGQSELLRALTGLLPVKSGSIRFRGKDIGGLSVRERIELGMSCVPEDRKKHGIVPEFSISDNVILKDYYTESASDKFGIMHPDRSDKRADSLIRQYDVRSAEGRKSPAGSLSGGNQQKVIIAREICLNPKFIIFAQPTRGLDVGAIEGIRKKIIEERDNGVAVLLISFELSEIMNLCDRIAAISKGTITGIVDAEKTNETEIGLLMAGRKTLGGN